MTVKLKQQLIFGLLAWGLFAFLPNTGNAKIINWSAGSGSDMRETIGAQYTRSKGEAGVKERMEETGISSENIRAINNDDIKEVAKDASQTNTLGEHVSGASNAAAARWEGSSNALTGAWNVVTGAGMDLFRSSKEIKDALKDYETKDNAENIAAASRAADALQKQNDQVEVLKKAVAVYEGADGQKIYMDKDMKALEGTMKGCIPMPVKLEQSKKCIFCPLFTILFNTAQTMSSASYDALAKGFKNLMLIGFALYIAYVSLKQVSSFTKQDGPKYLTEVLTQSFKVLLAYLILTHIGAFYDTILSPMLTAAMEFGTSFLFRSSEGGQSNFMSCVTANGSDGVTIAKGYYDASLHSKINCFLTSVQEELAIVTSIGSSLMCVSRNAAEHFFGLPDLTMLFTGLIIWVFSWLICLAFAFYLIDSVVRLGVVGGLMPFLVASWPFKLTAGYTKKGWDMFMNAFFTFVFLGLVVSVNIELSMQAATGGEGGTEKVIALINADKVDELLEIMSIGLMGLLFLILCCIFGFKLCSEAVSLAGQMGGGSGGDIGAKIGSLGAGAAKWGAGKTLKGAGHVAKDIGDHSGINEGIRGMKENVSRTAGKGIGKVGSFLGLKGANDGSRNGTGGKSGGGREGTAQNNSQAAQNFFDEQNKQHNNVSGAPASGVSGTTSQEDMDRRAQEEKAAMERGGSKNAAELNRGVKPNSEKPADNDNTTEKGGTAESGMPAPQKGNEGQSDGAGQQQSQAATSGNDGGAAEAGPRDENARENANRIVNDSKEKIRNSAQSAAEARTGKGAPAENSSSGSNSNKNDDNKGKDMQAQMEESKKTINNLQIQIDILERKLKNQGGATAASGGSADYEELRKLREEKKKAEDKLSVVMETLNRK